MTLSSFLIAGCCFAFTRFAPARLDTIGMSFS
jgi:hypothetical protein